MARCRPVRLSCLFPDCVVQAHEVQLLVSELQPQFHEAVRHADDLAQEPQKPALRDHGNQPPETDEKTSGPHSPPPLNWGVE